MSEEKQANTTTSNTTNDTQADAKAQKVAEIQPTTDAANTTDTTSEQPVEDQANNQNGKRILVADDEQYIRELYEEVLAAEGFQVDTASDGKQALEKILAGGYDAITLDVIMPQLDGLGILTQLKETPPKESNGPIILLTSLANDPAVKQALDDGAEKVIIKTEVTPNQFVDIVKQTIS